MTKDLARCKALNSTGLGILSDPAITRQHPCGTDRGCVTARGQSSSSGDAYCTGIQLPRCLHHHWGCSGPHIRAGTCNLFSVPVITRLLFVERRHGIFDIHRWMFVDATSTLTSRQGAVNYVMAPCPHGNEPTVYSRVGNRTQTTRFKAISALPLSYPFWQGRVMRHSKRLCTGTQWPMKAPWDLITKSVSEQLLHGRSIKQTGQSINNSTLFYNKYRDKMYSLRLRYHDHI